MNNVENKLWGDDTEAEVVDTLISEKEKEFIEVVNKKDKYKKEKKEDEKKDEKKDKDTKKVSLDIPVSFSKDPSQAYKFTRPCNSLVKGDKCEKGLECTYAHSISQLNLTECHFGKGCKNIVINDNNVGNANTGKICSFIHLPIETKEIYMKRVYNWSDKLQGKIIAPISKKVEMNLNKSFPAMNKAFNVIAKRDVMSEVKSEVNTNVVEDTEVVKDKIIVDVPKDMAMQMLELLIKSGKTNIELRIH